MNSAFPVAYNLAGLSLAAFGILSPVLAAAMQSILAEARVFSNAVAADSVHLDHRSSNGKLPGTGRSAQRSEQCVVTQFLDRAATIANDKDNVTRTARLRTGLMAEYKGIQALKAVNLAIGLQTPKRPIDLQGRLDSFALKFRQYLICTERSVAALQNAENKLFIPTRHFPQRFMAFIDILTIHPEYIPKPQHVMPPSARCLPALGRPCWGLIRHY
ncbi:hypothetical protein FJU08_19530 [Martelella alba]|uniref:Uncharacterized protein n=1 Tax=Martelella alba TaxID=2590451 RepID=A0A506U3M0_9HYPH|nr:hypothetical protein [Martelella alba]TPW27634.1 hypothetical protein FJU08_19530 [Martelella alba]